MFVEIYGVLFEFYVVVGELEDLMFMELGVKVGEVVVVNCVM